MTIVAPYDIPNILIDAYDVVVNRPKTAAYRAPGATNAAFASETIVDELAEKCGIDQCDFRLMNGAKEGTPQTAGPPFKRIGIIETVEAIKNSPHYKSKLDGPNRGRGWPPASGSTSACSPRRWSMSTPTAPPAW